MRDLGNMGCLVVGSEVGVRDEVYGVKDTPNWTARA